MTGEFTASSLFGLLISNFIKQTLLEAKRSCRGDDLLGTFLAGGTNLTALYVINLEEDFFVSKRKRQ